MVNSRWQYLYMIKFQYLNRPIVSFLILGNIFVFVDIGNLFLLLVIVAWYRESVLSISVIIWLYGCVDHSWYHHMGPANLAISIGFYHDVLLDVATWNPGFELALLVVGSTNHSTRELGPCVAAYCHTSPTREFMPLKRHKLWQVLTEELPWVVFVNTTHVFHPCLI